MTESDSGGGTASGGNRTEPRMSNLQRMMGRINSPGENLGQHSKRMRNIIIFCSTIGATLIVLIASFLLAGENSYNRRAKMGVRSAAAKMGLVPDLSECSGRGVWTGTACVCDLGYKGTACQEKARLNEVGPVQSKSVLLVVDHFGPLDMEHDNAIYYTTLASFLSKAGYKVTVLQTTPPGHQWDALKTLYKGRGIELVSLPGLGIGWENGPEVQRSYEVFRYLADRSEPAYELVFFSSPSGAGYYTLTNQRQGLVCLGSHFVVAIDGISEVKLEQYRKGLSPKGIQASPESALLVTDEPMLTREWLLQRSVEMADTVIATAKVLLDSVLEQGWKVPDNVYLLPYLTVPVAASSSAEWERADELIPSRQSLVREFVFVGKLGTTHGLPLFVSAIDNVLSRDQKAHRKYLKGRPLKVTFWGPNDLVGEDGELTGEHFIESRTFAWGNRVKHLVRSQDSNMKRLVRYLTEPGKGRIAIVPSLVDSSSFFVHQALRAGVPVMASNVRSVQEIVHIQDRREVLFAANDTVALARKMLDAWNNGILLGRPQVGVKQYERQWNQLLADLSDRPAVHCPVITLPTRKNPNDTPLASIVLVHHNRHRLLQQTIEAIEKQSFQDFEVVLVDDGSTDPEAITFLQELAWKWWQERGWKVLREPNRYLGAARNTGAKHARGKYVLFIDDDDIPKPGQLETMLKVAERTGADIVTTGHDLFDGQNKPKASAHTNRYLPLGPALNLGLLTNCFGDSSMLVHREYFIESGGFTEEYGVGFEDYEFLARAVVRESHLEAVGEPLRWYRQHPSSMSHTTNLRDGQLRFLRAYMEMFSYLGPRTQALVRWSQQAFLSYSQPKQRSIQDLSKQNPALGSPGITDLLNAGYDLDYIAGLNRAQLKQLVISFGLGFTFFPPFTRTNRPLTSISIITSGSFVLTNTTSTTPFTDTFTGTFTRSTSTTTTSTTSTTSTTTTSSTTTTTSTSTTTTTSTTSTTTTSTTTTSTTTTSTSTTTSTTTTSTTSTTTTTTTSSTTTSTTTSGTSTCPCRARRRTRPTSTTPKRPTCYTTMTVTPTLFRTAKPSTVTSTRTPTVTCKADLSFSDRSDAEDDHEALEERRWQKVMDAQQKQMDGQLTRTVGFEQVVLGDDGTYTTVTRVWLDAEPPVPPRAIQAEYDGTGEFVSVMFDRPLNVEIGKSTGCDHFLQLNSTERNAALLPAGDCSVVFVSPVEMRVKVAAKALHKNPGRSLQPGRLLVFRDHTLRNLDSLNHAYVSGYIEVGWPMDAVKPRVIIDAPSLIPSGEPFLRFDLSRSVGSAGRPWTDAHFEFNSTAIELAPVLEAPLQSALNAAATRLIKSGRLAFSLPSNLLHEYTSYSFRFTLWNVFGDFAVGTHVVSKAGVSLPSVTIEGPTQVLRSEPVRLLAVLPKTLPDGRAYTAQMSWSMLASPKPLRLRGAVKPALIFDRFSLSPGTYIISLKLTLHPATTEGQKTTPISVVQQHSFKVVSGPWSVEIVGGSRLLGALDTLHLQARPIDLAPLAGQQQLVSSDFDWEWSCSTGLDRAGPCKTRDGFLVELGSTLAQVSIPMSQLPGGETYVITVTASNRLTGHSKQDQITVDLSELPSVPQVVLEASPARPSTANDEELFLTARLFANSTAAHQDTIFRSSGIKLGDHLGDIKEEMKVKFRWESLAYCSGKYYAVLPMLDRTVDRTVALSARDDIIEERQSVMGSLLIPGGQYCFRVSASSDKGPLGWSYVIVRVKSAPTNGYCDLESPATGRAFESLFTLACHGWTADSSTSGALRYRFYRRTQRDLVPLAPGSHRSRVDVPLDVGHAMLEAHISDDHGVTTVVPIRKVSARLSNTTREDFMMERLKIIDDTGNMNLGYQVLALAGNTVKPYQMASGQAAMLKKRNTTELTNPFSVQTLTRLLHLLDVLTQNTYLDANDAGPFFLHSLLRIVPPKLPIDLRPVMLRIIHRLAVGMSRDKRPEGRCFDVRHAIAMIHALNPILENPRSGTSASFVVHEIKTTIETCLQREMNCQSEPFRISTPKLDIELGMVESGDTQRLADLCGFQVPSLLGISPQNTCLGYRCAIFKSNLMRNGSVDTLVHELAFRNSSMVLAPSFRSKSINFTIPLSSDFSKRVSKGGKPQCVWYEREANATVSRWNDRGCIVVDWNRRQVNCSCNHLTEFSVMIPEVKRPLRLLGRWWILTALLSLVLVMGGMAMYSLYRRHLYERQVKLGQREPKHRKMHGPPTYQQHLLRRQWRLRDSDEDTLLADDQTHGGTLGSKSTLTGGQFKESRLRTVSMASTIYGEEHGEDDSNATLDDLMVDEQRDALEAHDRLAPTQMRPYSHLPNEAADSRPPPAPLVSLRRTSVNQTADTRPEPLRRRSAEDPTDPNLEAEGRNIFEEETQRDGEQDGQRQGRRETLFNFLNGSGLWNQKKSDK